VQLGIGVVQGVRRPSEVQCCEPEREIEGVLLQVCTESKGFKHLDLFEGCRKECVQGSSIKAQEE
jgi:hypothetical protein